MKQAYNNVKLFEIFFAHLIAFANIECTVDNRVHARIRAGEQEQGFLHSLINFRCGSSIYPVPVNQKKYFLIRLQI